MDSHLLTYFLTCGPSRRFNAIPSKSRPGQKTREPFFESPLSSKAILFKYRGNVGDIGAMGSSGSASAAAGGEVMKTMLFFPYDPEHPEKGGDSIFYTPQAYSDYYQSITGTKNRDHLTFREDIKKLEIFDEVPTFNHFVLQDAFRRANMRIPEGYFSIPSEELNVMRQRVKKRLLPLVCAAVPNSDGMSEKITHLVDMLWRLDDVESISPLIKALRLPPHRAVDILSSWNGIAYFERDYTALEPVLKAFAAWQAENGMPKEQLSSEVRAIAVETATRTKKHLMVNWKEAINILKVYRETYEQFVVGGHDIAQFLEFLNQAPEYYWRLGEAVSSLEQMICSWKTFILDVQGKSLKYDQLMNFYKKVNIA